MKKTIFALGLIATLASCGGKGTEGEAPKADSTAVAVDSVVTTSWRAGADCKSVAYAE